MQKLYDERDFQRAVQAYLWATPMVSNGENGRVLTSGDGAQNGDLIPFSKPAGLSRFLTPNVTTPYMLGWLNLSKSPLVIELPAGPSAGYVDDLWQRPVMDVGLPGMDKGKGATYLLLGPGQKAPKDTKGYIVVKSSNFNNLFLFRLLSPDTKVQDAMRAKMRIYPYGQPRPKSLRIGTINSVKLLLEIIREEWPSGRPCRSW